jgi:pyruvate kinase
MKRKMKKTKIVATISDKRCDVEFIGRLYRSGMDVIRLNTAFQSMEGALKVIRNAREVSEDIAVLIDTKGPEIRTNPVRDVVNVASGEAITIQGNPEKEGSRECIVEDVPVHSHIFIDDGSLDLYVKEKKANALICQVMNNGKIEGHKSVNVPRVIFKLPSLTEKDREYIQLSIEQDVDFIAHSFVRNKDTKAR